MAVAAGVAAATAAGMNAADGIKVGNIIRAFPMAMQ